MLTMILKGLFIIILLYLVLNIIIKFDNIHNQLLTWFLVTIMVVTLINDFFIKNGISEFVIMLCAFFACYIPLIVLAVKKRKITYYLFNHNHSAEAINDFIVNYRNENNLNIDNIIYNPLCAYVITFSNMSFKDINQFNKKMNHFIEKNTKKNFTMAYILLIAVIAIAVSIFY